MWSCANLFTNYGKSVEEPDCVHNKLIEIGNNSSLLNSRDLRETHIQRYLYLKKEKRHIVKREIDVQVDTN